MSGAALEALARAKLNLFLHVGMKRPDGYHGLVSWVAFAGIGDRLLAEDRPGEITLEVKGPQAAAVPQDGTNLVLAAAHTMAEEGARRGRDGLGVHITLTKMLPVASGIGGGSADAAAALHLLNELWALGLDTAELMALALPLGSDVPVCVYNRSALMTGRGEGVAPGPSLPPIPIVLCNPGIPVATADVFGRVTKRSGLATPSAPPEVTSAAELAAILKASANDLEDPAIALAPAIRDVLAVLRGQPGALFARMSGSGATCFAIFERDEDAQSAAIALKRARPQWWLAASRLDC